MTTFTRLTVVGSARKAELVVPDDESLGGLIPRLMDLLEEPTGPVARPLALVRSTGEQLDAALSAAQQDLADGEQLRLVRADDAPPPPEVADVTDVVGDSYRDRPGLWSSRAREGLGAVTLGAAAYLAVSLVRPTSTVGLVGVLAGTAVAVVLGRTGHRWAALAVTAAAAGAAAPVSAILLTATPAPAPAGLLGWAGLSAVLVWLVLGFGVGAALGERAVVAGCAVGGVLAGLPLLLAGLGLGADRAVAVGAAVAVVTCGLLPWYALTTSGLTGLDDQVLAGRPSRRSTVLRTVDDAYRSLDWSTFGTAVALAGTATWLTASADPWAQALGLAIVTVVALRTRAFPLGLQQVPLVAAALVATTGWVLSRPQSLAAAEIAALLAAAAVVVAVAVGVRPAPHQRARLRRWGNLLEAVAVIGLLPLLLGVFGVYGDLLGAFR